MTSSARLVAMRHGESIWTDKSVNRFAGWVDVPLTERGRAQARHAGELLKNTGLRPDVCMTSLLRRSIITADIVLDAADRLWIDCERTWRLNERHYGAFQGQTRLAMLERYGERDFNAYRRSFAVRPPKISVTSPYSQASDARYATDDGLGGPDPSLIRSESLADLQARIEPWWRERVVPRLAAGQTVLVVTHGSVVRSIRKVLEGISDADIARVNVPTGVPLSYEFELDAAGEPRVIGGGSYLDPDAARAGIEDVLALGDAGTDGRPRII